MGKGMIERIAAWLILDLRGRSVTTKEILHEALGIAPGRASSGEIFGVAQAMRNFGYEVRRKVLNGKHVVVWVKT
jgi:hypothetical protein